MARHFPRVPFLAVIGLFFGYVASAETPATAAIKIGWIGPLTGDLAFLGVDSVEVAKREFAKANADGGIHGTRLELVVADDRYQAAETVTAYRRLVDVEKVKAIIVLTYGGMLAISPLAEKDNVLLFNPLDCDEELAALPKNSFCVAKKTEELGVVVAEYAVKHNDIPAAIIYFDGDPFIPKVARATREAFEKHRAPPLMFEGMSGRMQDFRSLLTKVREKKPRSLFIYGGDDFGIAMKQARLLGIEARFYSTTAVNSPGWQANAGETVEGTLASGWFAPRTPAYEAFLAEHKQQMGREPLLEVATVPTFDIARILMVGLRETMKDKRPYDVERFRDYVYGVRNFDGLSGSLSVDADGAVRNLPVGMYRFEKGSFSPAD